VTLVVFSLWFYRRYIHSDYTPPSNPNAKVPTVRTFSGAPLPILSPCNGKLLATEHCATAEEVDAGIVRAKKAQEKWKQTSWAERRSVLMDVMTYILEHQEEISLNSIRETGKTRLESVGGEILPTCEKIRFLCSQGERGLSPESRIVPALLFLKKAHVQYFPLGVIGAIVPGNYPFHNAVSHVATAIFGGNAIIVKVSEWGSLSRNFLQTMFNTVLAKRGHDTELVQFITGYGPTGAALTAGDVDKILFIGSPNTGKHVMRACVEKLTPCTLELGGKDPLIVLDDADFDQAVSIVMRSVYTNNGQNCIAAERIYVHAKILDAFLAKIVPQVKALRQGDSEVSTCDVGAIGMPNQVKLIEGQVADAVASGAKILAGGKRNASCPAGGNWFEPTVLTNLRPDMRIVREETFGPVMLVIPFSSDAEIIKIANASDFGLGASVFSKNYARAEKIASSLNSGMVSINEWGIGALVGSLPFGGVKLSGYGRFAGVEGLRDFCRVQSVVTDRFPIRTQNPGFMSYPIKDYSPYLMQAILKSIYGHGAQAKIAGIKMAISIFLGGGKKEDKKSK